MEVHNLARSRAKARYAVRRYKGKSLIEWAVLWFKMSNDAFFQLYGFNFNPHDYPYLYEIAKVLFLMKRSWHIIHGWKIRKRKWNC